MKRSLLKALGAVAVVAAVVPAGAQAVEVLPYGHSFSIPSGPGQPRLGASLPGTCTLGALSGTLPGFPDSWVPGGTVDMPIGAPAGAGCTGGPSITIAGSGWALRATSVRYQTDIRIPANGITLRWASLPGCKLVNNAADAIEGTWANGMTAAGGYQSKSSYLVWGSYTGTWANDGASCALAGQTEAVTAMPTGTPSNQVVNDTTNPNDVIQVASGF